MQEFSPLRLYLSDLGKDNASHIECRLSHLGKRQCITPSTPTLTQRQPQTLIQNTCVHTPTTTPVSIRRYPPNPKPPSSLHLVCLCCTAVYTSHIRTSTDGQDLPHRYILHRWPQADALAYPQNTASPPSGTHKYRGPQPSAAIDARTHSF
ncbi:hypothetical protein P154DRAFT_519194 [Amniculicola lignicola CBS 123094]|uniref:Uncharacterized protein n=1 Tax=Amniculicola lignicola CBS 123094 TaxID=1392246 RepID=A0A6A5WSA3_9PLEO|nr:hypothetical protein P154DRAFT_519194 [Amniculicola lignicola CBS 123094]